MNHRTEQLSSVIHRAVQSVIDGGLADPRLQVMITITRVEVAQDRRTATIFISVLPEKGEKLAMHGIRDAARHIRRAAADKTKIHRMPLFNFKVDKGMKNQAAIYQALAEVNAEREQRANQASNESDDAPPGATENDT